MLTITLLGTAATMPLPDRALSAAFAACGGHGRCGKCRVTVQGALSLRFRECCGDQSADR